MSITSDDLLFASRCVLPLSGCPHLPWGAGEGEGGATAERMSSSTRGGGEGLLIHRNEPQCGSSVAVSFWFELKGCLTLANLTNTDIGL